MPHAQRRHGYRGPVDRHHEAGKIQALDLRADDYVTKPFGMDELVARMRASLRHQLHVREQRPMLRVGDPSVDLVRRIVNIGDSEVKLCPKEYELLHALVQQAGTVVTNRLLGGTVGAVMETQYLRVYIRQLKQKVETDPEGPY
jgi:two-component system, OmpR family, KDP operon response regulator KdpE